MHFFGSIAFAALGILTAGPALAAATKEGESAKPSPCDAFSKQFAGGCFSGTVEEGRAPWLVGVAEDLDPADLDDLFGARGDARGPVDFSALPLLSTSKSVPFRIEYGAEWSRVLVWHNGRALTDLRARKGAARTKAPVALESGVNLFRVQLQGPDGKPVEVHATVRRLEPSEVEELAMARAYFDEVAPLLGPDTNGVVLLPTRFDATPSMARVGFKATIGGVPIDGAGVSVLLTRNAKTGGVVPTGLFHGLPDFSKVPVSLPKVIDAATARRVLAGVYAQGDERFVSQPALRWRVEAGGELRLMYHSFFYGLHASDEDFETDDAFTIARLWTDAHGGTEHEYEDMVRNQFALTGRTRVFDGPLYDLDEGLRVHRIELDETRRNLEGEHEFCASGPHAQVRNDSPSRHLAYRSGGRLVCGGLARDARPDLYSHAAPDLEATVGSPEDDAIEAWTAFSHTNAAAEFIRHHTGFAHDFPDRPRRSQLLVGINPQFRGYAAAVTSLRDAGSVEVGRRQGIFFGQEVRYGITMFEGDGYFMAGDFSRDADTIYHEYGHTILNALGVTTYYGFLNSLTGVIHEGFADYVARVMTGRVRQPSALLYDDPGIRPDARARFCDDAAPGDEHFLALDADDLRGSMRHIGQPFRGHVFGQSFCQALALTEVRLAEVQGGDDHAVLGLVVAAASDFPNRFWAGDASVFVEPLMFASLARWTIAQFVGEDALPTDHELRAALALHGFVSNADGLGAALTFDDGAWRAYSVEDVAPYTVATGVNPKFTMTFSRDAGGENVCHRVSGATDRVDPLGTTRFRRGQIAISDLADSCGDGRIFVRLSSCDGASACDAPEAERARVLDGSPVWLDVG